MAFNFMCVLAERITNQKSYEGQDFLYHFIVSECRVQG